MKSLRFTDSDIDDIKMAFYDHLERGKMALKRADKRDTKFFMAGWLQGFRKAQELFDLACQEASIPPTRRDKKICKDNKILITYHTLSSVEKGYN